MKTISLGIVGCGKRAEDILRNVYTFSPSVKITALLDPRNDRRELFKTKFSSDAVEYTDENSFFSHKGLDWVMICSPNIDHRRHIEKAVAANLKIFCEKPLATTIDDLSAIIRLINSSGTPFMVGFTLRYSPFYRKIKSIIESGEIGKIISFEFNENIGFNHGGHILRDWRRNSVESGGHMLEKCCHDLDLANWMTNSLPVKVSSFGGRNFFTPENKQRMEELGVGETGKKAYCSYHDIGGGLDNPFTGDGDIIDNQVAIIEYASGARATFHTNLNAGILERRMYILGSHGSLRGDVLTGQIETKKIGFDTPYIHHDLLSAGGGHGGGDKVLARHILDMMFNNAPSLTPVLCGATSAATSLLIDKARLNNTVETMHSIWKEWRLATTI